MRVIITGGAGFLGQKLARALLARNSLTDARSEKRPLRELVLTDVVAPPEMGGDDARVRSLAGDLADPGFVSKLFGGGADSVFHLAAVVSGEAEQNFDLGWRVNVDATRLVLEACRRLPAPPKVVFTSSVAVFGGPLPDVVRDDQLLMPQSSYGAQKTVGEYLVYDYTRKGFLDGRSLRLPTITVRPGKPNKAASSFASGILREPLNGVDAICPVPAETRMWLLSPRAVVANLVVSHEIPASAFAQTRSVNVPGISLTVGEMVEALRRVAGEEVVARVRWQVDPAINRIVQTWPRNFDAAFGRSLGMAADPDFDSIIRQYIGDELAA
jgi:nucleoside-diphosphate-sugar epimerase